MSAREQPGRKIEVEIRIRNDGQVEVSVHGQPGAACLDVARTFGAIGEIVEERRTPEYYAVETTSGIVTRHQE